MKEKQKYSVGDSKHYGAKTSGGFGRSKLNRVAKNELCENCGLNYATVRAKHFQHGWGNICRDCVGSDHDEIKSL